jgi:hypothetical protein
MTVIGKKVVDLIELLRTQRSLRVDKIFIGGGGNEEGYCRRNPLRWSRVASKASRQA